MLIYLKANKFWPSRSVTHPRPDLNRSIPTRLQSTDIAFPWLIDPLDLSSSYVSPEMPMDPCSFHITWPRSHNRRTFPLGICICSLSHVNLRIYPISSAKMLPSCLDVIRVEFERPILRGSIETTRWLLCIGACLRHAIGSAV